MKKVKISWFWFVLLSCAWSSLVGQVQPIENIKEGEVDSPSFTAEAAMQNPQLLMTYWGDTPIPISAYSEQDLQVQSLLNDTEDALIVFSPSIDDQISYPSQLDIPPVFREIDHEEITPYTWKWIEFEALDIKGEQVKMQLRRPNWWLLYHEADQTGNQIHFELAELELDGLATITRIWPSQIDTRLWDDHREGEYVARPITAKSQRISFDVWDYSLDSAEQIITATSTHPFWSDAHGGWVEIREVGLGEQIRLKDDKQAVLISSEQRVGSHAVYNFEVYRDHHFHAGEMLAYVHNCDISDRLAASVVAKFQKTGQCKLCADELVAKLKESGFSGQVIDLVSPYNNIWNERLLKNISTDGTHRAVLINGKVYDNLSRNGIEYDTWIKQFDAPNHQLFPNFKDF